MCYTCGSFLDYDYSRILGRVNPCDPDICFPVDVKINKIRSFLVSYLLFRNSTHEIQFSFLTAVLLDKDY